MLRNIMNPRKNSLFKEIKFLPDNNIEIYIIDNLQAEDIPLERQKLETYNEVCGHRAADKICRENISRFGGMLVSVLHVYDSESISDTLRPVKIILNDHVLGIASVLMELKEVELAAAFVGAAIRDRAVKLLNSMDPSDTANNI